MAKAHRICSVQYCGKRAVARGWCNMGWKRWRAQVEHNTHKRGDRSYNSKLSESDVREIRRLSKHLPYSAIGERFGIAKNTDRLIATGQRWGRLK